MMARSTTCSNQRPDTLMQDRRRQFDEIFLQRAAGPYIRVNRVGLTAYRRLPLYPHKQTSLPCVGMSQMCQNRTFVAGFLAITSNARHAERSNGRCPVLPHRPGPSRSTASAGSPNDRGATGTTFGVGLVSVSADCPFRPHAHVLVWSIQYWPSVR
jgi:hypothetical protein